MAIKINAFVKSARRSGLWPDASAFHPSSMCRARRKISWKEFEALAQRALILYRQICTDQPWHLWHGMSVYGIDGSKFGLPASDEIRLEFDPRSISNPEKGHYPQCLVSTAYDVLRGLPVARTVQPVDTSERQEALAILPLIPRGGVALFDRGYPSYEMLHAFLNDYQGFFLMRCPVGQTFAAVNLFARSDMEDEIISLSSPETGVMSVRAVKLHSPDGTLSVLLTNILDKETFPTEEIRKLYYLRWGVEGCYRCEKDDLNIDTFHSKDPNGIRQELFAAMAMAIIARTMMMLVDQANTNPRIQPQFKNAIMSLAAEAAILTPADPATALQIFEELLLTIAQVKHHRPRIPKKNQPRVTKKAPNKWILNRNKARRRHKSIQCQS